jgi:hypothetical protein
MLSKLNPMAEEFVPPSLANHPGFFGNGFGFNANNFLVQINNGIANGQTNRRVCVIFLLFLVFLVVVM